MDVLKTFGLFALTALAEIVGCYLPYLWLKQDRSAWLLVPAAASLALFAWLLSLHPTAAGRVYAAYGGVCLCRRSHSLALGRGRGAAHCHGLDWSGRLHGGYGHHHVRTKTVFIGGSHCTAVRREQQPFPSTCLGGHWRVP